MPRSTGHAGFPHSSQSSTTKLRSCHCKSALTAMVFTRKTPLLRGWSLAFLTQRTGSRGRYASIAARRTHFVPISRRVVLPTALTFTTKGTTNTNFFGMFCSLPPPGPHHLHPLLLHTTFLGPPYPFSIPPPPPPPLPSPHITFLLHKVDIRGTFCYTPQLVVVPIFCSRCGIARTQRRCR